jgi:predicted DCC family thiol-disulfide oxidoreductase YuxK
MEVSTTQNPILLFDGYCNLCNSAVQFVLKHEKNSNLRFASLQSEIGIQLLKQYAINPNVIDSLVFIEKGKCYTKSTAALKLSRYLKGIYGLGIIFIIIPSFIRNIVYDFIAKNRYKWFGKIDSCLMPDKDLQKRFL